jgi:galactose mutarotase-like enzyme
LLPLDDTATSLSTLTTMSATVSADRFRGEAAIKLTAGHLAATFLPALGMTGVSLRYRNREHLALPGGLAALRSGATLGLPLLAPWANRLARRRYRAAGVAVSLSGLRLNTDDHGLPIHGLLVGKPGWRVTRTETRGDAAYLGASFDVDSPAFPFPHRIELAIRARDGQLRVDTTLVPTGRRRVPVAFGWHPYLQLPSTPRSRWTLLLPTRRHLELDALGIPTGASGPEPAEAGVVGRRTFDDLYALGRDRRLSVRAEDGASIELRCATNYPYAQVWVPRGRAFAALEPMTAPTNALEAGTTPLVARGETYTTRFVLTISAAGS